MGLAGGLRAEAQGSCCCRASGSSPRLARGPRPLTSRPSVQVQPRQRTEAPEELGASVCVALMLAFCSIPACGEGSPPDARAKPGASQESPVHPAWPRTNSGYQKIKSFARSLFKWETVTFHKNENFQKASKRAFSPKF